MLIDQEMDLNWGVQAIDSTLKEMIWNHKKFYLSSCSQ